MCHSRVAAAAMRAAAAPAAPAPAGGSALPVVLVLGLLLLSQSAPRPKRRRCAASADSVLRRAGAELLAALRGGDADVPDAKARSTARAARASRKLTAHVLAHHDLRCVAATRPRA